MYALAFLDWHIATGGSNALPEQSSYTNSCCCWHRSSPPFHCLCQFPSVF